MHNYLSLTDLNSALAIPDLSHGPHAMSLLLGSIVDALESQWGVPASMHRLNPLVSTRDNYDRLGYAPDDVTRESRYSRHVSPTVMLRSHTSAGVPALLDTLRTEQDRYDTLHVLPGLVYRRDAVDRTHVGTPHQVDLWRMKARGLLGAGDLREMMGTVVDAVLPGARWRATPASHSYTAAGQQLDVWIGGQWLELAECGLAAAPIMRGAGLDPRRWCGLAMGMGLDRALMLRKGVDDIRLLRSNDPRVVEQMSDLAPYRPVSVMPPVVRDLSLVCSSGVDVEVLGDAARTALGADADVLAALEVLALTAAGDLPTAAAARLGITAGQANVLVRLTLQSLDRTLTTAEANIIRDRVYTALHEGPVAELIAG